MLTVKSFIGVLLIFLLTTATLHAQRIIDLELAFVIDASGEALMKKGWRCKGRVTQTPSPTQES